MFNDPLSVTYNSAALSLPRVGNSARRTRYMTADSQFQIEIWTDDSRNGFTRIGIELSRALPDPTPSDVFDDFRIVRNTFGFSYGFDLTRAETSVDVPRLRSALQSLVDTTFQGRLIGGEK